MEEGWLSPEKAFVDVLASDNTSEGLSARIIVPKRSKREDRC